MEENIFFKEIDGITYTSDMRVITGCKKDIEGHIIIPEGVEIIKAEEFRSCESITSIILPDSLKRIEWRAFVDCRNLQHIDFGNGIQQIGCLGLSNDIFDGCKNLHSVIIPSQVKYIGDAVFYKTGLNTIQLNEGLENIGNMVFGNCQMLTHLILPASLKHFGFHRSNHFANITLKTIPVDFILKITDTSYRYHYPEYRIITLTIGDRKVFIPNMMDEYDRSKVNAKINEEGVTDNIMYSMYKYAPSEAIRTEIGYHIYNEALKQNNVDKIDEGFRLKLKQRATGMIFHLLDQDRLEEAIMIINLGFLSEYMIRGFLKKTDNPAVRAYLLENLHKLDGDGKQMQL